MPVASARAADSLGQHLESSVGCGALELTTIPSSFDGLYFGPVECSLILGRVVSPWTPPSFHGVDDVLRSLARTWAVMRVPEAEMTTVRGDLADLAVDPDAASAQPIEGVLESSLGVLKPAVLGTPPHPSNGARPQLIPRTSTLRIGRFSVP